MVIFIKQLTWKKVDFLTWNIYLVVKKYNIEISSKEQFNDIKQNF